MSKNSPKVWITNRYTSRISHRAITPFERKNRLPGSLLGLQIHDTWDQAHQAVLQQREKDVEILRQKLKRAEASLKRAQSMKKPPGADDQGNLQ